ncbi:MAG: carbohydrate ABC transporter substrate-binding protein [Anaerolineae bacterium]|nr:carbohydrate ABC transporter substrate-binding protein [Anaerolineae bacterium]
MSRQLRLGLCLALLTTLIFSMQIPRSTQAQAEDKLEVFSYWTSGGEAAALNALFDAFKKVNAKTEIINAVVAGGAGTNAQAVLQTRLQGNKPPDTWQTHPAWELQERYVAPGYVEPVTDLYKSEGWDKVLPKSLFDNVLNSKDGQIYTVLTGVHRYNGLWYNKKLLDKNGITIGKTFSMDELFAAADKLKAAGVDALCLGDKDIWTSAAVFEEVLLGSIGPDKYLDLYAGKLAWNDASVKQAMDTYGKLLAYGNKDHAALSWDQAVKKLIEGGCAFNAMGDWAYGEFVNAKQKDNEDFGWVNFPGTDGAFVVVADGFVLPKNAPHKDNAMAWLKVIGGKEAQEAFNPLKGSIPVRSDVDRSKFGPYHNWSLDSFAKDKLLPSGVQGLAAPAAFQQALYDGATQFSIDKNSDAFANSLMKAAHDAGMTK